jgi:ubiquinone/menaquinone biosynthesis C-methylase UbiE
MQDQKDTSWENVSGWYGSVVGEKGHYYHETLVIPGSLKLLALKSGNSVLDLACGQGILERNLPQDVDYIGIDKSTGLIGEANKLKKSPTHKFDTGDITLPLKPEKQFTHSALILALQNIENIQGVFNNAASNLQKGGKFLIVINHPFFRIPRHSSWETDENNNTVYRKVNRYMSVLQIPILINPGQKEKSQTALSFHYPLSFIMDNLSKSGFAVERLEEWNSDKRSFGKHAKAENTARKEFPLFMALLAIKI